MIQKISSELVQLTRELAEQFCRMPALPGERPKRQQRLNYLSTLLKDGKFGSPTWAQVLVADGKQPSRADGQHTSHMLATCEEQLFPKDLNVTVDTFHLDSNEEVAEFFDRFNNPRSVRTNQDKLSVYIAHHHEVQHIEPGFLGKILSGVHYFNVESNKETSEKAPLLALPIRRDLGLYLDYPQNIKFSLWINRWHNAQHTWMVSKPGIVAEIYADWKSHPEIATQFWEEVFTESNPDADDESRELVRTFLDWNGRQPATSQDRFRSKAHKLWERFRRTAGAPRTPIAA